MGRPIIVTTASATLTLLFVVGSPSIRSSAAHGIIELNGVSAVAGTTSTMTLEVQHGCLPSEPTVQVQAFVGKPWRAVKPKPISGWSSAVTRQANGGWHITWTNLGAPIPFGTATFFAIDAAWPKKPGTYGMTVLQLCPNSSYLWNTPAGAATADAPSPPLTPKPEVMVVAPGSQTK